MKRYSLLIVTFTLVIIEVLKRLIQLSKLKKESDFAIEYHNQLTNYVKKRGDDTIFIWLTKNAYKMQKNMGGYGVASYRPPFAQYMINNYLLIVNGLDEIKNEIEIGYGNEHYGLIRSAILKYSGSIDERRNETVEVLKNPIRLFRESVKSIIILPLAILNEFGIISSRILQWIRNSVVFSVISGILSLGAVVSTVMTILIGWDEFIDIIHEIFNFL